MQLFDASCVLPLFHPVWSAYRGDLQPFVVFVSWVFLRSAYQLVPQPQNPHSPCHPLQRSRPVCPRLVLPSLLPLQYHSCSYPLTRPTAEPCSLVQIACVPVSPARYSSPQRASFRVPIPGAFHAFHQ